MVSHKAGNTCGQESTRREILAELGTLGIYELSPLSSSSFLPVLALYSRDLGIHRFLARAAGGYGGE